MAIGLFGLEDCDHGIALPGHLFHADTALEDLAVALKARTPGASRAHSRLASPSPLVLDSWCEVDESPSSASDLFDSPASWFSEEDGFGSLAGLRSAPLSSCSIRSGELAFMSGAETDSKMGTPAATPAPDAEEDAAPFWSISSSAASSAQLLEDEGGAARTPPAPRKRKRAARDGHAPSGEAICAALLAAVPAVEIEEEPAQKRARDAFSRTSSGAAAEAPAAAAPCGPYGIYMHPTFGLVVYGAPQMFGAMQMQMMPFSRTCSAETVAFSRTSSAAGFSRTSSAAGFSRTSSAAGTTRRGENVKGNPQMQKMARDGQKHWHEKCQVLRAEAEAAQTSAERPEFHEQRQMCAARNFKCQKESLLIFLQRATQQKLITPLPFVHADDEGASFVGWTGFRVEMGCGEVFRSGVEGLFPEKPKLNTLYHLFRRSGLVPEDWRRAWEGEIPFLWNPNRVSA
jgi:hypothetical protein